MKRGGTDDGDFEAWYRGSHRRLLASVTLIVGDVHVANEIVDEACVRALERWSRVSRGKNVDGYVFRTAMNLWKRRMRRGQLETRRIRESAFGAETRGAIDATIVDEALWNAVVALPARAREAVVLRYVADLPEREVAEAMGVAPGTVARTLHDARQMLAAALASDSNLEEWDR